MKKSENPFTNVYDKRNKKYKSPLIKWYQTELSYEDKWRFNLLTYGEYMLWQQELAQKAAEENGVNTSDSDSGSEVVHTFWQNDSGQRDNLSSNDYDNFLKESGVDVTNRNAVNFDSLFNEINAAPAPEPAAPPTPEDTDALLASINASNSPQGADRCLTQEEIEALFAAAAQGG